MKWSVTPRDPTPGKMRILALAMSSGVVTSCRTQEPRTRDKPEGIARQHLRNQNTLPAASERSVSWCPEQVPTREEPLSRIVCGGACGVVVQSEGNSWIPISRVKDAAKVRMG